MTTGTNHIEVYCPKCGNSTETHNDEFWLGPGLAAWTCPHCNTMWRIEINFYEITKVENEDKE